MDEIERVKQALKPLVNEDMDEEMRDAWLTDLARTAMLAMREPTEAMVQAAVRAVEQDSLGSPADDAVTTWQTMIDVASGTIPIIDLSDIDRP
jgi:hypothetical protein